MKTSIDGRAKMIPVMEIGSGDEVDIGGFDHVVEKHASVQERIL